MIDASEKSFKENVRITRSVVKLAERYGANVEAELGYVAKLGQQTEKVGLGAFQIFAMSGGCIAKFFFGKFNNF